MKEHFVLFPAINILLIYVKLKPFCFLFSFLKCFVPNVAGTVPNCEPYSLSGNTKWQFKYLLSKVISCKNELSLLLAIDT